jgi:hypothetical protein
MIPKCGLASVAFRKGLEALGWTENRNIRTSILQWSFGPNPNLRDGAGASGTRSHCRKRHADHRRAKNRRLTPSRSYQRRQRSGRTGFVATLSHPGGKITGFTFIDFPLIGKWLVKEIAPWVTRGAVLLGSHEFFGNCPVRCCPGHGAVAWRGVAPRSTCGMSFTAAPGKGACRRTAAA